MGDKIKKRVKKCVLERLDIYLSGVKCSLTGQEILQYWGCDLVTVTEYEPPVLNDTLRGHADLPLQFSKTLPLSSLRGVNILFFTLILHHHHYRPVV